MGYAVISHEAIIDSAWKDNIQPLLVKRFPKATPEDLQKAQAYAYGGAIIQDMGYYPFGSKFFSDLTHYVRSGDFILNLLSESQDLNEYAFALGSLSHYAADTVGHRVSTNRVVPMMYPKLKREFGPVVTYEDDPGSHLKVEFSFDVVQVALGNYAPTAYHSFIGFEVAQAVLERAFAKTYSIEMSHIFKSEEMAIGTYRFAVSSVLPMMTKSAWDLKKNDIQKAQPKITRKKYIYNVSHAEYRKTWGAQYTRPGFGTRLLAFIIRILPKVGPLRALSFQVPPPMGEDLFMRSFNETLTEYRRLLAAYGKGGLQLPNDNFDTGDPVKPGRYHMADEAYAKLVNEVNGKPMSPELQADILRFFANADPAPPTKKARDTWKKALAGVETLKSSAVRP